MDKGETEEQLLAKLLPSTSSATSPNIRGSRRSPHSARFTVTPGEVSNERNSTSSIPKFRIHPPTDTNDPPRPASTVGNFLNVPDVASFTPPPSPTSSRGSSFSFARRNSLKNRRRSLPSLQMSPLVSPLLQMSINGGSCSPKKFALKQPSPSSSFEKFKNYSPTLSARGGFLGKLENAEPTWNNRGDDTVGDDEEEEEGWRIAEDGTYSYQDNRKGVSDHMFNEWQSKKKRKNGPHQWWCDKGSTMLVYFRKIVDTSDENLPLKIFLIFVSLVIVASVSAVWYIYHQHQLQVFIGRGIRIIERPRLLYLADKRGVDKLEGRIGEHIPNHLLPYDCQHQADGANICLDWKYRARLRVFINYTSSSGPHKDVQCFKIEWKGVAGERLKDCFSLGQAAWYGIGESLPQLWPIDKWKKSSSPFVTGSSYRDAFGSVLERYLLTSEGVSISVDDDVPLYVSINEDDRSEICLESRYSDRYPYRKLGESDGPFLRYVLCAGSDVKTTHSYVMKTRWSEKVFDSEAVLDKYFEVPSWSTEPKLADGLNESSLLSFANSITRSGYKTGILTIGGRWEENVGDSTFDQENFPSARRTIIVLRNKGFLPLLTFSPYVSIKSPTFDSGSRNGSFIHDSAPTNKKKIPLLTYWKGCVVATMDLTNSATRRWIGDALRNITDTYEVVGFSFVGGESLYLPENYRSDVSTVNPDRITYDYENFTSHVDPTYYVSITSSTLQSRNNGSAHHNTKVSTFTPRRSDWSYDGGLKSVIPNVLTMGVLGNTIINIGSVGGDIIVATDDDDDDTKPDKELYIRWLQLATFMPIMQFSVAPFDYDDDERVVEISRKLLAIRNELLVPYFKKHLRLSIEQGSPIIRPLWWIDPSDSQTYRIDSQFLIYDKIVVAPVLEKGADTRNIYLPDGWWRDELRGSITKGKKWIYDYRAPLDQIPYFVSLEGAPID